jgi:hypothetical protein
MTTPGKAPRRPAAPAAPKPTTPAPAAPTQVLPEPREAPPAPRDPRFAHPLFVALAVLTSRWRFYARFKGAALDTAGPFYAVACALAALDAMLGAWERLASTRTRALLRAIKEDSELADMIRAAAVPSPYTPPADEAPLFADLRALCKRWSEGSASSPDEWAAREAWWLCYHALVNLLVLVDYWGSPAATLLFGFACDLLPPSQQAAAARPLSGAPNDAPWLAALRAHVADVIAAGLDATAPPGKRDLGRRMARRHIVEAKHAIEALFAAETVGKGGAA